MIDFAQLNSTDHEDFEAAMKIYCEAFPASERHSDSVISERVNQGLSMLYVGRWQDDVVFMALLWPLRDTDFILFDYMATKHTHRDKGIGSAFLRKMSDILLRENRFLILEVEHPSYGSNKEERRRRVSFYKRHGAKELKNIRYILPALDGTHPTEMMLMIFPEYDEGMIEGECVKNLITQIYLELYDRDGNDALLNSFIGTAKGRIELV